MIRASRSLSRRLINGGAACCVERLRQVVENVVRMFDSDRKPHVAGRDASRELLACRQLLVCSRGRMDRERACVADVRHMVEKLERIDEFATRFDSALELESDQAAVAALEVCVGASARLARLQPGEDDVRYVRATF